MNRKAFTLIELLVVVAIIGILSSFGVVSYGKYKTSAEKKQAEISLNSIYLAEQEYKSNNGEYYGTPACSAATTTAIVNVLFEGVDNLSEQDYNFCVTATTPLLEMEATNGACVLTLDENNVSTETGC